MKRSEVASKIQVFLENRGYCGNCDDGEAVLAMLEELGMLPPKRKVAEFRDVEGWAYSDYKSEWEPEDEA